MIVQKIWDGFREINFVLSKGICWFDAGMMALIIPMKLRKLLLDPIAKKYNISVELLFPCTDMKETQNQRFIFG